MVPNLITSVRFFLVPFIVYAILNEHRILAGGLVLLASITDGLDGWVARKLGQESLTGAMLDLFGDRCVMTPTLLLAWSGGWMNAIGRTLHFSPLFYVVPVVVGDALILLGIAFFLIKSRTKTIPFPSPPSVGKMAYVGQCVTAILIVFGPAFFPVWLASASLCVALALTAATYVVYMKEGGHVFTD